MFEFRVIFISNTNEDIKKNETENINKYTDMNICYNKLLHSVNVGNKLSEITRYKMSLSRRGKKLTDYQKNSL